MPASYPSALKTFTDKTDGVDDVLAADINAMQAEIAAIEAELGTLVKGTYADLKARLVAMTPVFLTSPLTSTSWDGDSRSTTAKTAIDLSAVFGVPAGVRAILARARINDSGSAAGDPFFILSPNNTANNGIIWRCAGVANDSLVDGTFIVPCDANGDVQYQVGASGASTMDITLQIWGYWPA